MTQSGLFWLRAQSPGGHAVRTGCLALGGVMLFLLAMSVLDTTVLRKTHDLGLTWTDGHADSQSFRIQWPGEYTFALEVADTGVATRDPLITTGHDHWTQRCGQPFPDGLTWSVRRFGHIIERRTKQLHLWCEDPTRSHRLGVFVGSFHARLGSGYSIRLEPVGGVTAPGAPPVAFRVRVSALSRWFDGTPILLLCDTLEIFGVVSIVLGCAQLFAERP